ncbi:MAG: hypothetical protein ACL93V_07430 [Candidatus Electrothrix sp. YB6]
MSDEIIAEVRAVKDALAAQHNYDLRSLFAAIKQGEAELEAAGVRVIPPPAMSCDQAIIINMSGRGDKDIFTIAHAFDDPSWKEFIIGRAAEYSRKNQKYL